MVKEQPIACITCIITYMYHWDATCSELSVLPLRMEVLCKGIEIAIGGGGVGLSFNSRRFHKGLV